MYEQVEVSPVVGQYVGLDAFDAKATSDGFGRDAVVTGQHGHLDPFGG